MHMLCLGRELSSLAQIAVSKLYSADKIIDFVAIVKTLKLKTLSRNI